jgi:hypothetical protein
MIPYTPTQPPPQQRSPQHEQAVLSCQNQSQCIVPQLQLARNFKIYLCKHAARQGVRMYYLNKEAFLLHPGALTVDNIDEADYIIYLPG